MKGYWGAFVRQGALRPSPRGEGLEPVNPASKRTYLGKTMSRPTLRPLDPRHALGQRQALAPGKAWRYREGNCPGCGNAPIEACRKADGLQFDLDVT
jgi:hypothetical protein